LTPWLLAALVSGWWLPLTEPARLASLISVASLIVIAGALVVLSVCWIVLGRR
jgi:hypothetical protein